MRNGDYQPSRLDAQKEAIQMIAGAKLQQNPENTVGLITMAGRAYVPFRDCGIAAISPVVKCWQYACDGCAQCVALRRLTASRCVEQECMHYCKVSLLTCCRPEVLVTLSPDVGKILTAVHDLKIGGKSHIMEALRIAQVLDYKIYKRRDTGVSE